MNRWSRIVAAFVLLGGWSARGSSFAPTPADLSRALIVAQLGIPDAEAQLKAAFPFRAFDNPALPKPYRFWGTDQTETLEPTPGAMLENAVNPSFAVEQDGDPAAGAPAARVLQIAGSPRGFSGVDGPGTYAANGDHYALRVSDLSGRIHVNDGIDGGPAGSVSQNLRRILNLLGTLVGEAALGDRILANRPPGGYATLSDLVPALGSEASYRKVRDFLTAHAWIDRNVANPVPLSATTASRCPVQYYRGAAPIYRFGGSQDVLGNDVVPGLGLNTIPSGGLPAANQPGPVGVFGLDTLNAQWIEIVGRAPVNVNSAPREVLIALLSGLQGFYVSERKRNNPRWQGSLYLGFTLQNTFRPGMGGSEVGYLMETYPIVASGAGISAAAITDEILACRNRTSSANVNYALHPFGGPFRSWHQFNQFVDNLVVTGVLADPRPYHVAYEEEGGDPTGFGTLVQDDTAKLQAARAIADVLKANFNPNLHLNELNPDANLHLLVDKTDLFVSSTEFCFMPTGWFEVESLGRVVRPTDAQTDALLASNNQLMAQAKVSAVLKLYDLHRETTQRQFYAGTLAPRTSVAETSNDMSLEIGPEPDNGVFPGNLGAAGAPDNEWDGYLALPTVGSVWHANPVKPKNTLAGTLGLASTPQFSAGMHVHFTLDGDACDHPFDRREIAGRTLAEEEVENHPDRLPGGGLLAYGGPYDLVKGDHRLAKSFRLGGGPAPALTPFVPGDLRVDGLYAERHSAPAYFMHQGANHFWNWNTENARGMVSMWIKPSFHPELTGKCRKLWDMTRYHAPCGQMVNVSPFELNFWPTHYNPAVSENSGGPKFWHNNIGRFEPASMWFGSKQWHTDDHYTSGASHEFGKITKCLNHLGHAGEAAKPSPMRAHRWINTTLSWGLNGGSDPTGNYSKLYVNGTAAYTAYSHVTMTGGWADHTDRMNGFDKHSGGAYNHMRIGGTSRIAAAAVQASGAYKGNYSSDVTVDELYVWKTDTDAPFDLTWTRGRYHNVRKETSLQGTFTSAAISLPPAPSSQVKVLGASWTWVGEDTDPATGARTLQDYGDNALGVAGADVQPRVTFSLRDGSLLYGPLNDDGFSPVLSMSGQTPVIGNPAQVKYHIHFGMDAGTAMSILLGTPVLDDVTIYWSNGSATTRVDTATPLSITAPAATALPDAAWGQPYREGFVSAGPSPVTWTITGGALPAGLSLDPATGELSGSPIQGGAFTFVVTATVGSNSSSAPYSLTVTGAPAGGGGCGLLGWEALVALLVLRRRRPTNDTV